MMKKKEKNKNIFLSAPRERKIVVMMMRKK